MNKYLLMKVIETAGKKGFRGRKRLQKVVFFLQASGLDMQTDYDLHRYGPYSQDISLACTDLREHGFLKEATSPTSMGGIEYSYDLEDSGKDAISHTETNNPDMKKGFSLFENVTKKLINTNLWTLELGSTILFYYKKTNDWDEALKDACEFKKVAPGDPTSLVALEFAQSQK